MPTEPAITATGMAKHARHGMVGSPTYNSWRQMIYRCHNPQSNRFHLYGARGISVCQRWRESFTAFYADMGERPNGTTLDRRDNDGDYTPSNCRWSTNIVQYRNRRSNRHITLNQVTMTVADWSEMLGIKHSTICWRLDRGWPVRRALMTPVRSMS